MTGRERPSGVRGFQFQNFFEGVEGEGGERVGELQPSAVIEANITTPRLVVHEGAVVRCRIRMGTQNGAPSSHLEPRTVVGRSHATASR